MHNYSPPLVVDYRLDQFLAAGALFYVIVGAVALCVCPGVTM